MFVGNQPGFPHPEGRKELASRINQKSENTLSECSARLGTSSGRSCQGFSTSLALDLR